MCKAGEHDLTDPANVGLRRRPGGAVSRYCKPCNRRRSRDHHHRRREAAAPSRRRRPARGSALETLQMLADGETVAEIALQRSISQDAVYRALGRLRHRYGVRSNAALVAVALADGDIQPVHGQPLPPGGDTTAAHTASLLRLIRGERRALKPRDVQRGRMLDHLYAFSEPHAVSVLWTARLITAKDLPQLTSRRTV
ncbi:hypothetical protein DEJ49_33390 [Streptomyces venezuelae]|uniref:HTH luxR-type domain-containing protein n=1 Tax=Streptomyces venezuelae TaxID=54571 RepID=A0A5P2CQV7_STRVZ|nr:hypothetical protein DEJ49_33390 [Streptomyces venezuelae]